MAKSMKIRRGDMVYVLTGRDRGKTGKVLAVLPAEGRVIVDGVQIVKKHVKGRGANQAGQRITMSAPINVSNVQLICPQTKKPTKVGITRENGKRQRVSKQAKAIIE